MKQSIKSVWKYRQTGLERSLTVRRNREQNEVEKK